MKKLAFALPLFALAACGEEPAPAPEPAPAATEEAEPEPVRPAPDQAYFTAKYAEACPSDEPVNTAQCRRPGMGATNIVCKFGLGDDEYLRNEVTLEPSEDDWVFADPENVCVG